MPPRSAPVPSLPSSPGSLARWCVLAVLTVLCLTAGPGPSARAEQLPDGIVWTATVNGRNVERAEDEPVRLDPARPATVVLRVENAGDRPVEVPYVRLAGAVAGLTLYSYTTQVELRLEPGQADGREYEIRLLDLADQATGLVPSRISLLDGNAHEISGTDLTVDVLGEVTSVYGVFGAAVGALGLLLLAGALWRLATGRLHCNRWRRALAFTAPGLALGFLLTFGLAALRLAVPDGSLWGSLLAGGAAVGFVAGYLTPAPGERDDTGPTDADGAEDEAAEDDPGGDGGRPAAPEDADEPDLVPLADR